VSFLLLLEPLAKLSNGSPVGHCTDSPFSAFAKSHHDIKPREGDNRHCESQHEKTADKLENGGVSHALPSAFASVASICARQASMSGTSVMAAKPAYARFLSASRMATYSRAPSRAAYMSGEACARAALATTSPLSMRFPSSPNPRVNCARNRFPPSFANV